MFSKKGVSLIVSYTLLIVIAIGISTIVYSSLKVWLPSDTEECPADMFVTIEEINCDTTAETITFELSNRGLFNITSAFIRFGEQERTVLDQLNPGLENFPEPIAPGKSILRSFNIADKLVLGETDYKLQVQPAIIIDRVIAPCKNLLVTQDVVCN